MCQSNLPAPVQEADDEACHARNSEIHRNNRRDGKDLLFVWTNGARVRLRHGENGERTLTLRLKGLTQLLHALVGARRSCFGIRCKVVNLNDRSVSCLAEDQVPVVSE